MSFDFSLQTLIQGLLVGGVYGLIGVGLSLIFGVMRVINFAHGDALALGMFLALFLFNRFHVDPYLSLLIAIPAGFALGYAIERLILSRIPEGVGNASLLATLGLGLIFSNAIFLGFGARPQSVLTSYSSSVLRFGGVQISIPFLVAGGATVLAILCLDALLYRTELGRAIRATAQNPLGAELQGVDTRRIQAVVFGLGNLGGALLGGLFIGLLETIGATGTIGTRGLNSYRDAFGLIAFLLVLLFRPEGLFGKTVKRV